MKTTAQRYAVGISLSLNVVLLAVLASTSRGSFHRLAPSGAFSQLTNRALRVLQPAARPLPAPAPGTVEVTEPFHWSELESQDYRLYVANLRAIGCPEATVRDIVVADVNELFRRRVKELVDAVQNRFWELLASHDQLESLVNEKERELRALDEERDQVLDALLGGENRRAAAEEIRRQDQRLARSQVLDFLPADKLERCLAIEEKFQQLRQEAGSVKPPPSQAEIAAAFERLRQQQDLELQQTLTADDWAEYKLRNSRFADLRQRLAGFEATEEEMRSIVRIREELEAASGSPPTPVNNPNTPPAERQALEQVLGKERMGEFERAQDARFQEVYQVTDRLELAPEVAADAFEMRKAAEDQAREIRSNQGLAPAEREDLLKSIRDETERSLGQTMGTQAFALYRNRFGYWLDQIAANSGH